MPAATTVESYLASLPPDRRAELSRVRDVVRSHLPKGWEEGIVYGMISWYLPLSRYPDTYNKQPLTIAGLATQKNHNALYLMCAYGDPESERILRDGFRSAGKKLDMGKSCVRFKTADALALDVIGEIIERTTVDRFVARYEEVRAGTKTGAKQAARKAATAKKAAAKKTSAKPAAKKPGATNGAAKKPAATNKRSSTKAATKAASKAATKAGAREPATKRSARRARA